MPMSFQEGVPRLMVRDVGPDHRRYTPDCSCQIVPHGQECYEINRTAASPLARVSQQATSLHAAIRRVRGVLAVDITPTQVAVQKDDTGDWGRIDSAVNAALKRHFRWSETATLVVPGRRR